MHIHTFPLMCVCMCVFCNNLYTHLNLTLGEHLNGWVKQEVTWAILAPCHSSGFHQLGNNVQDRSQPLIVFLIRPFRWLSQPGDPVSLLPLTWIGWLCWNLFLQNLCNFRPWDWAEDELGPSRHLALIFRSIFQVVPCFPFCSAPGSVKTDLFPSAVKQKVNGHYESIKKLVTFQWWYIYRYFLRAKGMSIIDGVSSLPPARRESVQLSNDHKLATTMENSILWHIKITHGIALIDWIFWKSLGNNFFAYSGTAMFAFPSRWGLHYRGDVSLCLLWAPIRGASEQLEYLQLGLVKCDEFFLSPF